MSSRRIPRHRSQRGSSSKTSRKSKASRPTAETAFHPDMDTALHPLYGEIPLISGEWKDAGGVSYLRQDYDPDYSPKLPSGAIRGDPLRQDYGCDVPRYFYVDEKKTCLQCGQACTFFAAEQKYWYETLKFNFASKAIRCLSCRKQRRTEKALREQIAAVKADLREGPDDPALLVSLAETIVHYYRRTGHGNLNEAIATARRALKSWSGAFDGLYWEAACHHEAGRLAKARKLYAEFVERAERTGRFQRRVKDAREYLESGA